MSQCQKKSSGLYGARRDIIGRHTDHLAGRHSVDMDHKHGSKNVSYKVMHSIDARYYVTFLMVCRALCTTVVVATSSEGFLVDFVFCCT